MKRIKSRKEPVQSRSKAMRDDILEAAAHVLKLEGAFGFTTNKVADRAGVSVASIYQYYPDKESLLFHLVENEWTATCNMLFPILEDTKKTHKERLRLFIEKFYETEADEGELRDAMATAGVMLEQTKEYLALQERADEVFTRFLSDAIDWTSKSDLMKKSHFIHHTISSYSDNMPAKEWTNVKQDAHLMADMICSYFKITN